MNGYVVYQASNETELNTAFNKMINDQPMTLREEEIMDQIESFQNREAAEQFVTKHGGIIREENFDKDLWEQLPNKYEY